MFANCKQLNQGNSDVKRSLLPLKGRIGFLFIRYNIEGKSIEIMENILDKYEIMSRLGDNHDVFLVKGKDDGILYVQKTIELYAKDVYMYLLAHPINHIPAVKSVADDGYKVTVIEEYVNGKSLADRISEKEKLSVQESLDYVKQLCLIVKDLHECVPPIIHRDIKPENIILYRGEVFLVDLDASKFYTDNNTKDTYLLGTYGYAAPEQYGFGKAGISSDIYAIGKVLNTMLTGEVNGETEGPLKDIIACCTEVDARNRYQSVEDLLNALKQVNHEGKNSIFKLPGLRSGNKKTQIISGLVYIMYVIVFLTAEFDGVKDPVKVWYHRITYLFCFTTAFLYAFNYRDIWKVFGIDRIRNKYLRTLFVCVSAFGLLAFMMILFNELVA